VKIGVHLWLNDLFRQWREEILATDGTRMKHGFQKNKTGNQESRKSGPEDAEIGLGSSPLSNR